MIVDDVVRLVGGHYPLAFFGLPGLGMLVGGLVRGTWVLDYFDTMNRMPTGNAIVSVSLCIGGLVALCTGIGLHAMRLLIEDATKPQESA